MSESANLIINADDYGYSDGVSRGILKAAECGTVKATGILANSPDFDRHIGWLAGYSQLDIGVHLTLTSGQPMSSRMVSLMAEAGRTEFMSSKFSTALAVLSKKMPSSVVEEEWDCQIQRCVAAGLQVRFINSHEHIHGLPSLYTIAQNLSKKYNIPHIRVPAPEFSSPYSQAGFVRSMALMGLGWFIDSGRRKKEPMLIGVACSGKLNDLYMQRKLPYLLSGRTYELMCHPGYFVPGEITDRNLLDYHDWEGELGILCDKTFLDRLHVHNIRLIGYRDL
ncbi:MAG: ChbG/HpnK family deacetylase [Desulforhopalus sp.]